MRARDPLLLFALAACGTSGYGAGAGAADDAGPGLDAGATTDATTPIPDGAAPDAGADADAATCTPTTLLVGGSDVAPQGWSVVQQAPATLSYGPDYVKLVTSTTSNAATSGQLLINYPGAFDETKPFKIEIEMLVEAVNAHNPYDSAAAILIGYTPPFGVGNQRLQMIYLDSGAIGWGDDTQSYSVSVKDNAYHTYVIAGGGTGTTATVTIDGASALTRNAFTTNGAIAIGDQTNDANVDSTLRIRSVKKLCP